MFIEPEHFYWASIFFIVIELLGITAALHAVFTVRTSQGAIAWAISLIFMPILTLIPYCIFGRDKFSAYIKARRQVDAEMHQISAHINWRNWLERVTKDSPEQRYDVIHSMYQLTKMPLLDNNNVELFINGKNTFEALFKSLREAKKTVLMSFFVINNDGLGVALQKELIACVSRGVEVYLLYDRVGSIRLPKSYVKKLLNAGVQVKAFSVKAGLFNRFQWNFRCHRKITVIDGEIAFIGGHNVGDEYLGKKPPLSPWRDTHIKITGPAAICLQEVFAEDWYWVSHRLPTLTIPTDFPKEGISCQVIPSGPADTRETCSLFFVEMINSAKQRIWITSPYFVPDESVFKALELAVLRGVDVRLLLPARRDHVMVFAATVLYSMEAMKKGIRVFNYIQGFIHQKVVLVDDDMAAIGSANLDNRSFRLNFEIMALILDKGFAGQVENMLLSDFAVSTERTVADTKKYPTIYKLGMGIARLLSPIL